MSKVVLQCKNLSKIINNKKIISNVSFELNEKDILGFIGPNGAGKTTIIKSILGLYKIDTGEVIINNYNLNDNFVKAISKVGAIVENPDLYMYMTGYENLMISSKIYNIPKKRTTEIIKLLGMEKYINIKVSKYSLGMKQRLGIAQAIIHNPKVLILDEPTNGLDPSGIMELNNLIKKISNQGMAIIISSHILSELESLCNKFCFIKNGKIIAYETSNNLKKYNNNYIFEVSTTELNNKINNCKIIDKKHILVNTKKEKINSIIKKIINSKINIYEIKKESSSLEKIFLDIMESDTSD